jgi:hypothetical protein
MVLAVRVAAALTASFVFGAVDQFLGGIWMAEHVGFWTISVSAMSAPWLALPFVVGCTQERAGRAARLGLAATVSALLGYFVMTVSPIEGVRLSSVVVSTYLRSQLHVILPGLVTGPLYGWFGYRWRTSRAWASAALIAGAFCFEPLARSLDGQPLGSTSVSVAEVMVGIIAAAFLAAQVRGPARDRN